MSPSPALTEKWVPIWPKQPAPSVIAPPEDGKWALGSGGAVVWTPTPAAPAGLDTTPDTDWHIIGAVGEPAFIGAWTNWADVNYSPARFRKLADGMVILDGLITGGATGTSAFIMPVGYRLTPQQSDGSNRISHFRTGQNAASLNNTFWFHQNTGDLQVNAAGAGAFISLCGIRYYAGLA